MTVMTVGGTGFLGSKMARSLLKSGRSVVIPSRSFNGTSEVRERAALDRATTWLVPINFVEDPMSWSTFNISQIVYAAGNPIASTDLDQEFVTAQENLLANALRGAEKANLGSFHYISSLLVYGTQIRGVISTELGVQPDTRYAEMKLREEQQVVTTGLPGVILRLSNVYGIGQNRDSLMDKMVRSLKGNSDAFSPSEDQTNERRVDFLHISDLGRVVVQIANQMTSSQSVVAVGGGRSISPTHLYQDAAMALATDNWTFPRCIFGPGAVDPSWILRCLGCQPLISVEAGLQSLLAR
jgi:nucleoside-diphosphate-sugar epimerase